MSTFSSPGDEITGTEDIIRKSDVLERIDKIEQSPSQGRDGRETGMNTATRIDIRARLVDALSDLNYSYRQGKITRDRWIAELKDLETIGVPVDWTLTQDAILTDVILSELHTQSKRKGH